MTRRTRRATTLVVGLAAALAFGTTTAYADDDPGRGRPDEPHVEVFDMDTDPLLTEDALISDNAEANVTPTQVCSNESVQTGPNPAPATPSFQMLYVLPSDQTAVNAIDVPRSCSDGAIVYSALARSSRNMQTWLAKQNVGMNLNTLNIAYTHNYTGAQYPTRGVRRFRSTSSVASWNGSAMFNPTNGSSPRLTKLRNELIANGFDVANTKYITMLHADTTKVGTSHYLGIAEQGGAYGMVVRAYTGTSPKVYLRYGCTSDGDVVLAHESTHMLGSGHVTDTTNDLMYKSKGSGDFNTSPVKVWDYGRNNYHTTALNSAYTANANLSGSYYTC